MSPHENVGDTFDPAKYLSILTEGEEGNADTTALIILNSAIEDYDYFIRLYSHASFRLCADGGANRLSDLLRSYHKDLSWKGALRIALPDAIHGDLDSLKDDVRSAYESLGVEVSQDGDQYSTDFNKAVKKVLERLPNAQDVLVVGSIGGRVDQGVGLLGEFYREQIVRHPHLRLWLFNEASVSTILKTGTTTIRTKLSDGLLKRNIGILPLYGPAVISTTGLEWDVQDWPTEIGGQLSTSNHIVADAITISTNKEVLFTVQRSSNSTKPNQV
jgi:thiamine pyrophosphokinase